VEPMLVNTYRLKFMGRPRKWTWTNAFYQCTIEVQAKDELEAALRLYDTHDRGPSDAAGGLLEMDIELLGEVTP